MRIPFITFGIDTRGANVLCTLMLDPSRANKRPTIPVHLPLFKLDARGMAYTRRMFGEMAFVKLNICHPNLLRHFDLFLPLPSEEDRFATDDETVIALADNAQRAQHVAVGLSDSGLQLIVARRNKDTATDIGRSIGLLELAALGAERASRFVGDIVLRGLIEQHEEVFATYPHLAFGSQDQP